MYLEDVTPEEIIQISRTLKQSHSSGYDQINPALAGLSIPRIAQIIAALINCSFCSGIFPDDLKIAKVIPLHKSDSKENIVNYRPTSVLPYFSKYFEKTTYNRTISFLEKHSIIKNNQFGFRQDHSTYMPIALLQTKISHRFDQGQFTIGVFLDLAKAFDSKSWYSLGKTSSLWYPRQMFFLVWKLFKKIVVRWFHIQIKHRRWQLLTWVFHRGQSWGHFCSWFISMTCVTPQIILSTYCSQMTQMFFSLEIILLNSTQPWILSLRSWQSGSGQTSCLSTLKKNSIYAFS